MELNTEDDKKDPEQNDFIKEFTTNEMQVEYELNSSKNAVTIRQKKSGQSSTKLRSRRTSHPKAGEKSKSKSSTKKVTGRTQTTTGQSVVYRYCTSCLPPYYTLDSLLLCTECSLQTRQNFGPITDVTII